MKILKTLWQLPFSYLDAIRVRNKSLDIRYQHAQHWSNKILKSLGYQLEVINLVELSDPMYLVCNHQSTFDPVMVVASYPYNLTFVSKEENKKIPIISKWANNLELIYFNRKTREGNISMLRQATQKLKNNHSVLIFPEGTRSKSKVLGTLKPGALQPAKLAKQPICVVTLINSYEFNKKNSSNKTLKIVYGPIIETSIFKEKSYEEVIQMITSIMQNNLDIYQS